MAEPPLILAIDQGTTSSRAILFDSDGEIRALAQRELPQIFPRPGWVEHDPERIWQDTLAVCREAIARADVAAAAIAAIGITNQRETTVIWDRASGRPIHNAIVWQDRRTAETCARLRDEGLEDAVRARTGLVLDPYFSGTKIGWLLDNVDGARDAARRGDLAFGTVDSWLLWKLSGGAVHASDATNASRTLLFDIHRQDWDADLAARLGVPPALLPRVGDSVDDYASTDPALFGGAIAVRGIAGDQQAATVGQACFAPGMIKSTYGTGCFVVLNTGENAVASKNQLLTTVAYRLDGRPYYALEGSIFVAGAALQWLRDGLGIIADAAASEELAAGIADTGGVYMVPAFTGLGAPYWDADARGALIGLTRDSGIAEIVRAALEAVCHQTDDLMQAMAADHGAPIAGLRVDGGMVANDWLMQHLADTLGIAVERPVVTETTALGSAYLAGIGAGLFDGLDQVAARWRLQRRFDADTDEADRARRRAGWREAVARVRSRA